ncbi:hypothetical protein ACFLSA_06010 [Bacteroidota bacterium]
MRKIYDEEIKKWLIECVPEGYYPEFGRILDRRIPWSEKESLILGTVYF